MGGKALAVNQLDSYLGCWDPWWWLMAPRCFLIIGIAICCVSVTVQGTETEENPALPANLVGKTE